MNPRSPGPGSSAGGGYPSKRARHSPPAGGTSPGTAAHLHVSPTSIDPDQAGAGASAGNGGGGKGGQSSSFRNVSACNRCRLRKNRCDQRLPSCASCEKAAVKCVGYDPITKREIPRSYVFYLETRVDYLENLLRTNGIQYAPSDTLDLAARPPSDQNAPHTPVGESPKYNGNDPSNAVARQTHDHKEQAWHKKKDESEKLNNLVSNIGMVSVQGASDPRYLGSTSGISFARVVFAAVKSSVSGTNSEKGGVRPSKPLSAKAAGNGGATSMRDSFFGLQTKPTIKQAPFPDKDLGLRLVTIFFEYSNPQIPVLHRGEFMKMFDEVYADPNRSKTPRELYMLNIVFAIGSGIFLGEADQENEREGKTEGFKKQSPSSPTLNRGRPSNQQCQPEEYHASAIVHLEACLSSGPLSDRPDGFGGGLEELQAVLLLAGFALLRPVAPGLWYIVGVAVRLAVDLGLHYEDGKDLDVGLEDSNPDSSSDESEGSKSRRESLARERGRREWIRDLRRRLWWCTYAFDRLVSTCVGRPFGITDQVITTEFPSLLEDKYITKEGFLQPPGGTSEPTYKHVSYHYFRLRLLQSEILQVLQFQQAQLARSSSSMNPNQRNPYMHTQLPSPFLSKFDSFRSWRIDVDRRLWEWKESAPTKARTGVQFSIDFLELNYWQAIIMLYRQSLSVPAIFEGEFNTSEEVESPSANTHELKEDEERVFLKVAEAGQKTLRLYRSLHRLKLVNYTFLATHHLFMAGISFLYAIWHSPIVRSRLTMDEVDFTILAATSVLGDLMTKCPPAEACRDAFDRMSKATVQMCMSTTGFSSSAQGLSAPHKKAGGDYFAPASTNQFATSNARSQRPPKQGRPMPNFDMGLNDLFPPSPKPTGRIDPANPSYGMNNNVPRSAVKGEVQSMENFPMPRSQMSSPMEYSVSPVAAPTAMDTSAIDPSLLPPAQNVANTHQSNTSSNPYSSTISASSNNSNIPPDNLYGTNYENFDFSAMDFMQGGMQGGAGNTVDGGGLDLGFGLGWEGVDHDFSEGNQLDLFDGFFFGGNGGGY